MYYNIKIEDLNRKKILMLTQEIRTNTIENSPITINLMTDDGTEIDYYHVWLSDGIQGLYDQLNTWKNKKDYYTQDLDFFEKEEFLLKEIEKYVHQDNQEWLDDTFNDIKRSEGLASALDSENIYFDVSIEWILDFFIDIFYYTNTEYDLENKMNEFLGYYSGNYLTKVDGTFYLFLAS